VASFVGTNDVAPVSTSTRRCCTSALLDIDLPGSHRVAPARRSTPTPPGFELVPGSVTGSGIDADHFSELLAIAAEAETSARSGHPELVEVVPPVSDEDAAAAAADAEAPPLIPLEVTVGDHPHRSTSPPCGRGSCSTSTAPR
jgi:hypothetical protein